MIMVSFRTKKEKEHLLEKARKMEEYARMIVECIEESDTNDYEYSERNRMYDRQYREEPEYNGRYGYRMSR